MVDVGQVDRRDSCLARRNYITRKESKHKRKQIPNSFHSRPLVGGVAVVYIQSLQHKQL